MSAPGRQYQQVQKRIRQIQGQQVHKQTVQATGKDAVPNMPNTRAVDAGACKDTDCSQGPGSCALPDQHILWALLEKNPGPDMNVGVTQLGTFLFMPDC